MTETASVAEQAEGIAREWHAGQFYHGTQLDFVETHLEPIVGTICELGGDETAQAIGWLHDADEDTGATLEGLAAAGMPPRVVSAVDRLSRRPGQSHRSYMKQVMGAEDLVVPEVKDVDSTVNLNKTLELEPILISNFDDFDGSVRRYTGNLILLGSLESLRAGRHEPRWAQFMAYQAERARVILRQHEQRFGQTAVSLSTGLPRPALAS